MPRAAAVTLVLCLLALSVMISQVYALQTLNEDVDGISTTLFSGNLLARPMWVVTVLNYPSIPRLAWIVSTDAFAWAAIFALLATWLLRIRRGSSWLTVGLADLLTIPVVYTFTWLTLRNNTSLPQFAGPIAAVAILGTVYALMICATLATFELLAVRRRVKLSYV